MLQENINLKDLNTFGISVNSAYFDTFSSVEELQIILQENKEKQLLILGGGSNVLFMKDFEGLTLQNKIKGIQINEDTKDEVVLKVGSGEVWHQIVLYAVNNNWGGMENLSLIPGSVGASPMQNIGAYGKEIKDIFDSLEAVEIATGKVRLFSASACKFGYRESIFKRELKGKYIITSVSYRLQKNPKIETGYGAITKELENNGIKNPTIRDVSNAVIAIRESKLPNPKEIGNAGSFFKNPVIPIDLFEKIRNSYPEIPSYPVNSKQIKVPAGWLIENAGWKGKRINNFGVHQKQALVLVNYGGCSGGDIYNLSKAIIQDIQKKYGIELEREVNIIT